MRERFLGESVIKRRRVLGVNLVSKRVDAQPLIGPRADFGVFGIADRYQGWLVIGHGAVVAQMRLDLPILAILAAQHSLTEFDADTRTFG